MGDRLTLRVSTWTVHAIAWPALLLFAGCAATLLVHDSIIMAICGLGNLALAIIALVNVLITGPIVATAEEVRVRCLLGTFAIRWSDVTRIEFGTNSSMVLFGDGGRRLVLLHPAWWSGPDRHALATLIDTSAAERRIPVATTHRAEWLLPKNTKLPRA